MGGDPNGRCLPRGQLVGDLDPECSELPAFHDGRLIHFPDGFPLHAGESSTRPQAGPFRGYRVRGSSTHLLMLRRGRGAWVGIRMANESHGHHERRAAHCNRGPGRSSTDHEGATRPPDSHPCPVPQCLSIQSVRTDTSDSAKMDAETRKTR